jgi:hypothetical protein
MQITRGRHQHSEPSDEPGNSPDACHPGSHSESRRSRMVDREHTSPTLVGSDQCLANKRKEAESAS